MYYQFISIERSVESLLATRDEASVQVIGIFTYERFFVAFQLICHRFCNNQYLQYELERLRPSVSQLVRAVGTIPATTARERLAQSEIAKKVHSSIK